MYLGTRRQVDFVNALRCIHDSFDIYGMEYLCFKAAVFLYPNKKEVAMKELLLVAETWTTSDTVHFLAILLMPIILGLLILIFGLIDKAIRKKKI